MRKQLDTSSPNHHTLMRVLLTAGISIVIASAAIYVGLAYDANHNKPSPASTAASQGSPGSIGNGSGGGTSNNGQESSGLGSTAGTVTSIGASSITIQPSAGGDKKTYAITDTTSISNAKQEQFGNASAGQASAGDIHTGDSVVITPDKSNPSQAIGILINP
jgi:hypothetical protein